MTCNLHFPPLPMPNSFHKLPLERRVAAAYDILEQLRRPNGGYIASPYSADDGSGDAYNVFWIRDIMFATYANEYLGCFDKMVSSFRLVMDIFKRHHLPIIRASVVKPHLLNERGKFMPARVHPASLETITDDWGHHQLDVFGLFMYKNGGLDQERLWISFHGGRFHAHQPHSELHPEHGIRGRFRHVGRRPGRSLQQLRSSVGGAYDVA